MISLLGRRLLVALCLTCTATWVEAEPANQAEECGRSIPNYCTTSIISVIARPEQYVGKTVRVRGFLRVLSGQWGLFPSAISAAMWERESAIEIQGYRKEGVLNAFSALDGQIIRVSGRIEHPMDADHDQRFRARIVIGEPPFDQKPAIAPGDMVGDTEPARKASFFGGPASSEARFYDEWCGGPTTEFCPVSVDTVVARPDVFVGAHAAVSGYLRVEGGAAALYPRLDLACHGRRDSAVQLRGEDGSPAVSGLARLDGRMVRARGRLTMSDAVPGVERYILAIDIDQPSDGSQAVTVLGHAGLSNAKAPAVPAPSRAGRPAQFSWAHVCTGAR